MKIYNTLTRRKEEFTPLEPGKVKIYTCGPTVYAYAHIGNFRSYVFSDIMRRTFEYLGYQVRQVMNITDVGHLTTDEVGTDKLELGAAREGKTPEEIARFYEKAFFEDAAKLNIQKPHITCRATEHIQDMIALIRRIEANGFAYHTKVGLIFDTMKYQDYARLGRLKLDEQKAGARVDVDPDRKNPSDFALWITNQPKHLMQWDSPWGKGFPSWHIECSAMSIKYLGERFDIHTGGVDHIPVHHTNEKAQNFAATGKEVVRYWVHGAFLTLGVTRMGKSEGNLVTISELESQGFEPAAFRYLCLTALYRSPLNFTEKSLKSAQNSLHGLLDFGRIASGWPEHEDSSWLKPYQEEFRSAVADDLNVPQALAVVWNLVHKANKQPDRNTWNTILDFDRVLGLGLKHLLSITSPVPEEVRRLAQEREQARTRKDWAEADRLRGRITELGYAIEDTPKGPRLKPQP
ncbi:cysteine--tRNA ligase [candidate division WOR-3 bacterium JGI_Cruoil_03_51_56]|uniref:Cysteine--tRNA ligase n=1 Tax=candidate division WOR-3 bacterium JGI_Cruoil_03_51_56 TaxID=1973747 RepID=A0A235BYD2_UNCW3|nr:MAG: cysteine--tRNA ligase [candidate division WOR-3 bacterium JGI_Cruoil_03_51_56]